MPLDLDLDLNMDGFKTVIVIFALLAWLYFLVCVGELVHWQFVKGPSRGASDEEAEAIEARLHREGRRRARRVGSALTVLLIVFAVLWWMCGRSSAALVEADGTATAAVVVATAAPSASMSGTPELPVAYLNVMRGVDGGAKGFQAAYLTPSSGPAPQQMRLLSPGAGGNGTLSFLVPSGASGDSSSPFTPLMVLVPSGSGPSGVASASVPASAPAPAPAAASTASPTSTSTSTSSATSSATSTSTSTLGGAGAASPSPDGFQQLAEDFSNPYRRPLEPPAPKVQAPAA